MRALTRRPAPFARKRGIAPILQRFIRLAASAIALCFAPGASFGQALTQYTHTAWRIQDGDLSGQVSGAAQTSDGYLWIATAAGLLRFDGVRFQTWRLPTEDAVYSVLGAKDGT